MNKEDDNTRLGFLIKKAAISLAEKDSQLFDVLDKDDTIINPKQDELDGKIYSMIDEHLGKKTVKLRKNKRLKKSMLKVAVFVLILSAGFIVPFITVDAFREKVINFYIEKFNTHTSFIPSDNTLFVITPGNIGYIPYGYTFKDEYKTQSSTSFNYYNGINKRIEITLFESNTSFGLDTEESEEFNINVNHENGYIYKKTDSVTLLFKLHGSPVVIYSDELLSNEELIKIAESIK